MCAWPFACFISGPAFSLGAFAAVLATGFVVAWGRLDCGADIKAVQESFRA